MDRIEVIWDMVRIVVTVCRGAAVEGALRHLEAHPEFLTSSDVLE
jgi:hypothetical protein